jgi:uncharacterized repeat protein (TIGR03803 family)
MNRWHISGTNSKRGLSYWATASCAAVVLTVLCGFLVAAPAAYAQTESLLYSFAPSPDGASPVAPLIMDSKGNLYGTTPAGGANRFGTVFKIDTNGTETVLHNFPADSTDGAVPEAGLVMDANGNLYGTTCTDGAHGIGTVFKISATGDFTTLYSFAGKPDGGIPYGALVLDSSGNMYGTTRSGGAYSGGTVFELTPSGTETVLHSFGHGTDGKFPYAGLVRDSNGNLYGTTLNGGTAGLGTVFQLAPNGAETVLHNFTGTANQDGSSPYAPLIRDGAGNLYGTTLGGSNGLCTAFEVSASGKETILYVFPAGDGAYGGLVEDSKGNLYGTTKFGGSHKVGGVFEITTGGAVPTLYSFVKSQKDGFDPVAGLLMDSKGNLYGTTTRGGHNSNGTVFKVVP